VFSETGFLGVRVVAVSVALGFTFRTVLSNLSLARPEHFLDVGSETSGAVAGPSFFKSVLGFPVF
jgi:hypothetical protein